MPGLGGAALAARLIAVRPVAPGALHHRLRRRGGRARGRAGRRERPAGEAVQRRPARPQGARGARPPRLTLGRLASRRRRRYLPAPCSRRTSPSRRPVRSTSPAKPPAAAASCSAPPWTVLERAGVRGADPADARVPGHLPPGRRPGRRRAADPVSRPRRPHPGAPLRFHRQPGAGGRHHVRGRGPAAAAVLLGHRLSPGARARRPAARDAPGRRRAARPGRPGGRHRDRPAHDRPAPRRRTCRTSRSTWGTWACWRPDSRALERRSPRRRAALDRPQGPRQPVPGARRRAPATRPP